MWGTMLAPLYGGGFGPALAQVCTFYYVTGALLHWAVPALFPVQNIQPMARKDGVLSRDAFYSIGESAQHTPTTSAYPQCTHPEVPRHGAA